MNSRTIRHRRHGYTLFDLLVTVAVLGAGVALLMPAVKRSQFAANETVCEDNLRLLGQSFINYERDQRGLPPRRTGLNGSKAYGGWGARLIPYVDEKLGSDYHDDYDFYDPINQRVAETRVRAFICPAAPVGRVVTIKSNASGNSANANKETIFTAECGPNDYISSNGLFMPADGYGIGWPAAVRGNQHQAMTDNDNLAVSQITDGVSNTILLIERAAAPQTWRVGKQISKEDMFGMTQNARGAWSGFGSIAFGSFRPEDGTTAARGDATDCAVNCNNAFGIYGFHENGANILLCDGSVRFVSTALDGLTFARLTTRDDGQLIAADGY